MLHSKKIKNSVLAILLIGCFTLYQSAIAMEFLVSLKKPAAEYQNNKQQAQKQLIKKLQQELNLTEKIQNVDFISNQLLKITTSQSVAPLNFDAVHTFEVKKLKQLQDNLKNNLKNNLNAGSMLAENIELDGYKKFNSIPTDTHWAKQWYLQPLKSYVNFTTTRSYGADFQAAWTLAKGQGQVIAVVDSGYIKHSDLGGDVTPGNAASAYINQGYDFVSDCRVAGTCIATTPAANAVRSPTFDALDRGDFISAQDAATPFFKSNNCTEVRDSSWHGTFIAGVIAAQENNIGIVGAAPKTKILPVRVGGKCGSRDSDILKGMLWAAGLDVTIPNPNPVKIINLSLGGNDSCQNSYKTVFTQLENAGVSVVISAGNDASDVTQTAPANCNNAGLSGNNRYNENLIVVSSIDRKGELALYGNYNNAFWNQKTIDVSMSGGDASVIGDEGIYSTSTTSKTTHDASVFSSNYSSYIYEQGTSFSAPMVASLIGLIREIKPSIEVEQIRTVLKGNSMPLPNIHFLTNDQASRLNSSSRYSEGRFDCVYDRCGAGMPHAKLVLQSTKLGWSPVATHDGGYGEVLFKTGEVTPAKRVIKIQNISGAINRLSQVLVRSNNSSVINSSNITVTTDCMTKDTDNNEMCSIVLTANNTNFTDEELVLKNTNNDEVIYKVANRDRVAVPSINFVDPFAVVVSPGPDAVTPPTEVVTADGVPVSAAVPVSEGSGCSLINSLPLTMTHFYFEWILLCGLIIYKGYRARKISKVKEI